MPRYRLYRDYVVTEYATVEAESDEAALVAADSDETIHWKDYDRELIGIRGEPGE